MSTIIRTNDAKASTNITLSKVHPVLFKLAVLFTSLSVVLTIILTLIASYSKDAYEHLNYSKIEEQGQPMKGTITSIKTNYSTTINSHHPKVISYSYNDDGKEIQAQFKTLSPGPIDRYRDGDLIAIKVLNSESGIIGLEPFSFPFYIFYIIPVVFFIVGAGFFVGLFFLKRKQLNQHINSASL